MGESMEVWEYGSVGVWEKVWKYGSMEVWKYGSALPAEAF